MAKKLLMGNEAIGLGAIRAGVSVVTGYPGTPSTEVLETVSKNNDGSIHVEWSTNEKSALEVAAGASYTGARVMVTMKQVGLNVASDPLMSLNYIGVKGGMVIVVADDPGPISSQTEQDTRHFGKFAKIAVFDPSNAEEAYLMIGKAFEYSEKYHRPVIFRPTTRVCHSCAPVELLEKINIPKPEGFIKDSKWVIFPRLTYLNHIKLEEDLKQMSVDFCDYERNFTKGKGKKGIASGGGSYAYVKEALKGIDESEYNLLKISTYPVPEKICVDFLNSVDEVLVVEELDPVIEKELIYLYGLHNIKVTIKGKLTGNIPNAGENSVDNIISVVYKYLNKKLPEKENLELPQFPVRPPVLCAGCPHRASFFAVKEATKGMNVSSIFR